VDQSELERFRRENGRVRRIAWYTILGVCVGCGLAIGQLWSYAVGFPAAGVLASVGLRVHLHLDKARWLRRFPELRDTDLRRRLI
jgi:hypothetical protein